MLFKQKKTTAENGDIIKMNESTDYRNVSPLDYPVYDDSMVSREANREFVKKSKPDDRCYNYRDPIIDADIEKFKLLLDIDAIRVERQRLDIKNGAEAQRRRAEAELNAIKDLITLVEKM